MTRYNLLAGRLLISLVFIVSGLRQISTFNLSAHNLETHGIPLAGFVLFLGITIELVGSLFLIIGYQTRYAALALMLFLFIANLIFHTNLSDSFQQLQLLKDLAIFGGLLFVYQTGAGELSLDERNTAGAGKSPGKRRKKSH